MNIERLRVELKPVPAMYQHRDGMKQFEVKVWADGKEFTTIDHMPGNHFAALFDELMEMAACRIKQMVKEASAAQRAEKAVTESAEPRPVL